jgi:hypothetical protein
VGSSLEIVGWPRSVGGFHGAHACFGVFTVLVKVLEVVALVGPALLH